MKQKLLNKLWLRVGMLVAVMTTALAGTTWAETATWSGATALPGELTSIGTAPIKIMVSSTNTYTNPIRVYANTTITIKAETGYVIQSVAYEASSTGGYVTAAEGATVTPKVTPTVSGKVVTWTLSDVSEFTFKPTTQTRCNGITVTYAASGGTPTCAAPTFNPVAGTYSSAQNVTISTTTEGATIYYTTDGTDPTTGSSVYSSAISVSETATIKAMATATGYNNSSIATAAYTITVPSTIAAVRAQETGSVFTKGVVTSCVGTTGYIQDATAAICVYGSSLTVGDEITVSGTLSTYNGLLEITTPQVTVISQNNAVTPVVKTIAEISNDIQGQLVKIEEATVTAIDGSNTTIAQGENTIVVRGISGVVFAVGDKITFVGNVGCYNSVQIVNPTDVVVTGTPRIEANDVSLTYDAVAGEISYTVVHAVTGTTLTATTTASWISNFTVTDEKVTFTTTENEGSADREATITLSYTGAESVTVTVTQAHYVADYAELPFEFDGGKEDIANTVGLTQTGLGSDYNAAPLLKFDGTGDNLVLKFNERPGKLTFSIKGNGFSGGTFKVQASADGDTYEDVATYTSLGDTETKTINNLGENVRYIKWIYTNKSSGNVALGNITLAKYSSITVADPVFSVAAGTYTEAQTVAITCATSGATIYYTTDGSVPSAESTEYTTAISVTETTTIKAIAILEGVTSEVVTATYTISEPFTVEDGVFDFVEAATAGFDYGSGISTTSQSNHYEPNASTWTAGNVTLVAGGNYRWWYNGYELRFQKSNGTMTISVPEGKVITSIVISGGIDWTVNNGTYTNGTWEGCSQTVIFTAGTTSGNNVTKVVVIYEESTVEPITVKLNGSGYATFASTQVLDFTDAEGYTAWAVTAVNGSTITFSQITGAVPAGTGVLLMGEANTEYTLTTGTEGTAPAGNLLVGITEDTDVADDTYYGLKGENFVTVNAGTVPAGKALLPISDGNGVKTLNFDFNGTGIEGVQEFNSSRAQVIYDLTGRRVEKATKGIYIINGKKVVNK